MVGREQGRLLPTDLARAHELGLHWPRGVGADEDAIETHPLLLLDFAAAHLVPTGVHGEAVLRAHRLVAAVLTLRAGEAVGQDAAPQVGPEATLDPGRWAEVRGLPQPPR